jgi:hypothetical protein
MENGVEKDLDQKQEDQKEYESLTEWFQRMRKLEFMPSLLTAADDDKNTNGLDEILFQVGIVNVLKKPRDGFKDLIADHFLYHRDEILELCATKPHLAIVCGEPLKQLLSKKNLNSLYKEGFQR